MRQEAVGCASACALFYLLRSRGSAERVPAGAMRNLITLQLGSYANYVGAHFWNMQARAASRAAPPTTLPPRRRVLVAHAIRCGRAAAGVAAADERACSCFPPSPPQDEAAGWAESRTAEGAAFAQLDADVLYREGHVGSVRRRRLPALLRLRAHGP